MFDSFRRVGFVGECFYLSVSGRLGRVVSDGSAGTALCVRFCMVGYIDSSSVFCIVAWVRNVYGVELESFDSVDRTTGWGLFLVISVSAYAGWGLLGHGIGVFVGTSIAGTTLWMCLKNEVASGQTIPPLGGYMGQSVAVLLGLAVFLVGDGVGSACISGVVGFVCVCGGFRASILVVPQSICGALFPKVVKASFTERMALYRSSAWTTLGAIVLLSLGVVVFGTFLLGLLFGPEAVTDESVRWLRYIALSLIPFAICSIRFSLPWRLSSFGGCGWCWFLHWCWWDFWSWAGDLARWADWLDGWVGIDVGGGN